jgi:hypothetical protein
MRLHEDEQLSIVPFAFGTVAFSKCQPSTSYWASFAGSLRDDSSRAALTYVDGYGQPLEHDHIQQFRIQVESVQSE